MKPYNHTDIEKKWRAVWDTEQTYRTLNASEARVKGIKPYYVLDMFPYPSGSGLHVGHPRGYIASDVFARMKRMQGFNVLHPMGFDSFGLPAEQYAIQTGNNPGPFTDELIVRYREQLAILGFSFDWSREVATHRPDYYRWTQWIFLQMYNAYYDQEQNIARPISELVAKFEQSDPNWKTLSEIEKQKVLMNYRLAYEGEASVNWCPELGTVLANDEIVDGPNGPVSERGGFPVEKKQMRQWFMRITAYGDRLLEGLETIDWPENIKEIQRNWIGKSEGSEIDFTIERSDQKITVFTTRADTLFGVTYAVLAPEHSLVSELKAQATNGDEIAAYLEQVKGKTEIDRTDAKKEKTGVCLEGVFAVNPANGEQVPVWVADYVLANYGTGAVMAVPAHDERDFAFAKKYNLPVRVVIGEPEDESQRETIRAYEGTLETYIKKSPTTSMDELVEHMVNFSKELPKGGVVLEIGSGHGRDAEFLKSLGVNIQVSEVAESTISELNRQGFDNVLKINFVLDEFGVEKYDGIFANAVFLHAKRCQLPLIIRKCNWALKQNGVLCFKVKKGLGEEIETLKLGKPRMFTYFSDSEIREILESSGFDITRMEIVTDGKWIQVSAKKIKEIGSFSNPGLLINSDKFDGLTSEEAKIKITEHVGGKMVTRYKFRDAIFARQRYWGEPIPLVHHADGTVSEISDDQLPLRLPDVTSYQPSGTGESPLATVPSWVAAGYETNTMPGWAGSSWYFLRYMDPHNADAFAGKGEIEYWNNVNMYVGGAEHATGHLLYSRFWHKALRDLGYVPTEEPFAALRNQGMIGGTDGRKMSKRWGNVINPDDVVRDLGADTMRVYESFMGPFESHLPWSTDSIVGARRFIERVWRLAETVGDATPDTLRKSLHKTIKKVTDDIHAFSFNTAVSAMMIFVNDAEKAGSLSVDDYKMFLQILAPFAPHVTEELWNTLGGMGSIHLAPWPVYDDTLIVDGTVTIGIQINGKVRAEITLAVDADETSVRSQVLEIPEIIKWIDGKEIKKFIYVPGKIISIVI